MICKNRYRTTPGYLSRPDSWRMGCANAVAQCAINRGVVFVAFFFSMAALADVNHSAAPHYEPRPVTMPDEARYLTKDGAIAIVGYNDMQGMLESLDALFVAAHPRLRFSLVLKGTRTAPPALARGESAFAPMGAEFSDAELAAYYAVAGTEPLMFRIAHTSLDPRALSGPIGIFVHRSNPLAALTTAEVARIFTGSAPMTWAKLGATGEWAGRTVLPCGLGAETALGAFMRRHHFSDREFGPGFTPAPQSAEVVTRIARDPQAIGFAAANRGTDGVKLIAIASAPGGAPVSCTTENVVAGRYAYDRHLLIYVRRAPDGTVDSLVCEYLRLVFSREGQQAIGADARGYLPLCAGELRAEIEKLEAIDHPPARGTP